jgi:hypothetical protein
LSSLHLHFLIDFGIHLPYSGCCLIVEKINKHTITTQFTNNHIHSNKDSWVRGTFQEVYGEWFQRYLSSNRWDCWVIVFKWDSFILDYENISCKFNLDEGQFLHLNISNGIYPKWIYKFLFTND